jgi:hypothetical protein
MNKCCPSGITLWCCFASSGSSWDLDYSHHLCSYDASTLGSPIVLGFLIGLLTSLSIGELSPTIFNVSDGVCCVFSRNYVPRESEAFHNVAIIVLFKTLVLEIKHIFIFFLFKNL